MPELPDLEIYKENLKPGIINKKIAGVLVLKPKILKKISVSDFKQSVVNKKLENVERFGKLLAFTLSSKEKLFVHLMLYGQLQWARTTDSKSPDTCLILEFARPLRLAKQGGRKKDSLRFIDGTGWMKAGIGKQEIDQLGVEPLSPEFSEKALQNILQKKRLGNIKERLVDQKLIAGIGNAYVDEILWEAKIKPERVASLLKKNEISALYKAIIKTLKQALGEVRKILNGGISGEPRDFLAVHRKRECPACGSKVKRIELNKKGTYFCPECQK